MEYYTNIQSKAQLSYYVLTQLNWKVAGPPKKIVYNGSTIQSPRIMAEIIN